MFSSDAISEQISSIEEMLLTLEDVCDQQDFTLSQLTHKNQLGLYKRRKQLELEKVKGRYFFKNTTEH